MLPLNILDEGKLKIRLVCALENRMKQLQHVKVSMGVLTTVSRI
jgi:hypothetical protein